MVKTEDCKWSREKRVYIAQGVACFLGLCCVSFGISCIIFQARANICNTSGPGGVPVGRYPSTPNDFQPRNCIPECEAQCSAKYMEGPQAIKNCRHCLDYCTHPWGAHIDDCAVSKECDFEHHSGILHYCQGMAFCFSKCAGECIHVCKSDGKIAVWTGIVSLVTGLLPFFLIPIIAGPRNMYWVSAAVISFLPWLCGLILACDTFNLNMNGKGWAVLWDEQQKYNITPNYMVGLILCLILISAVLMLFAYWDPREVWYRNQANLRQEQFLEKAQQERASQEQAARESEEAYEKQVVDYAKQREEEEIAQEQQRLAYLAASVAPPVEVGGAPTGMTAAPFPTGASVPPPNWGKKNTTAAPPAEGSAPAAPQPGVNVTVGLSFAYNDDQEVVVESVTPGGPAARGGLIEKNDVVCEVGDTDPSGHPMKEVYKQPIENWAPIVKGGAPGTSVRFILARHAEQKRFIADIVREPVA